MKPCDALDWKRFARFAINPRGSIESIDRRSTTQHIRKLSSFSIRRRNSKNATTQPLKPPISSGIG